MAELKFSATFSFIFCEHLITVIACDGYFDSTSHVQCFTRSKYAFSALTVGWLLVSCY